MRKHKDPLVLCCTHCVVKHDKCVTHYFLPLSPEDDVAFRAHLLSEHGIDVEKEDNSE